MTDNKTAYRTGDQVSYVSVHGLRVWWVRDADGLWHASDERGLPANDAAVSKLLWARDHEGREGVEWKPTDAEASHVCDDQHG